MTAYEEFVNADNEDDKKSSLKSHINSIKSHIKEIKTACLWKKKSSKFKPDYCPVLLDGDPWIVQPYEYYDEIDIDGLNKKHLK